MLSDLRIHEALAVASETPGVNAPVQSLHEWFSGGQGGALALHAEVVAQSGGQGEAEATDLRGRAMLGLREDGGGRTADRNLYQGALAWV